MGRALFRRGHVAAIVHDIPYVYGGHQRHADKLRPCKRAESEAEEYDCRKDYRRRHTVYNPAQRRGVFGYVIVRTRPARCLWGLKLSAI